MKRDAKLLLMKAIDSLVFSIEVFNRPSDRGRATSVLIFLDHAFEMLLKSCIRERGGKIRELRKKETIGFDACIRRALSNSDIKFLTEDQAITLQAINGLRDAAQHFLLDVSEEQLYLQAQSGVTLFRDILKRVFLQDLSKYLPSRVLPISTIPFESLETLFDNQISQIRKLLAPGRRQATAARARLRPLMILDSTIRGERGQPSPSELRRIGEQITKGTDWRDIFSGVASMQVTADGQGNTFALRLTKREGIPVRLVAEGTPGASVVAVKRVNELDYYNLGHRELATKVSLTQPKLTAMIRYLDLESDDDLFCEFRIGRSYHKRFSQKAIIAIKQALKDKPMDEIWAECKPHARRR